VSFTSPTNGSTVSSTITLSATAAASGTATIANVQFKVDGNSLGTVSAAPYTIQLNTTTLTNGSHSVTAVALDTLGNSGSASIMVTVSNGGANVKFSYQRPITIAHSHVPGSDQINFPILIEGVYSYLANVSSGGQVQSPNGYDIIFTSDSAGTQLLKWEIDSYNPATGAVTIWVKLPVVSHTVDTVFYMSYGNPSASNQQSQTSVWDSNYQGVWHLSNGTTLSASDSTSHGNNGTIANATAIAGQIDGGASFNGSNAYVDFGGAPSLQITASMTVESWINVSGFPGATNAVGVFGMGYNWGFNNTGWIVYLGTDGGSNHYFKWTCNNNGSDHGTGSLVTTISSGTWHHLVGTFDGATWKLYLDGTSLGSNADSTAPINNSVHVFAGALGANTGSPFFNFDGLLDELRVSNTARSADWIATEYNNQSNPSAFLSVGTQQSAP
jgi:hypothetical protein